MINENVCLKAKLMETKLIYRVMYTIHTITKFNMLTRKKSFPRFFTNPTDKSSTQTLESTDKRGQTFLNFN